MAGWLDRPTEPWISREPARRAWETRVQEPIKCNDIPYRVPFRPNYCPRCASSRTRTTKTMPHDDAPTDRRHLCHECGYVFQSYEVGPYDPFPVLISTKV